MSIQSKHLRDSISEINRTAFFPFALALFFGGCYGLYYAINEMMRSYSSEGELNSSVWNRLLYDPTDRIYPILLFLGTCVILFISIKRKFGKKTIYYSNHFKHNAANGDFWILTQITSRFKIFGREWKSYREQVNNKNNLNDIEDFVYVKDKENEKAKKLGIVVSSGIGAGGSSYVSSMPNFNNWTLSNLTPVSVHTSNNSGSGSGGEFLSRIYIIDKKGDKHIILGSLEVINEFLEEQFPHLSTNN